MTAHDKPVSSGVSGSGFQAPPGTRDLYPEDALRRRYVTEAWRAASIRHGFDEIDGPTFETCDLYAVKSGEGILGELFQAFSGKSPEERARVQATGQAPYALRPEFTPTLARMYAAKAGSLPKPARWFTAGPFFRAERPQRGRLREFLQWNCDVIGLDVDWVGTKASPPDAQAVAAAKARADAEVIACCVGFLRSLGLRQGDFEVRVSDRQSVSHSLEVGSQVPHSLLHVAFDMLDMKGKRTADEVAHYGMSKGLSNDAAFSVSRRGGTRVPLNPDSIAQFGHTNAGFAIELPRFGPLAEALAQTDTDSFCVIDTSIVRGLAYYTGMVFEVIVDGERAVAGGGRYDNLIELFGGPPTPAVGFGMGDVVLSLVLQDKGLMPTGKALLEALDGPACRASMRPDVFVIPSPAEGMDGHVRPLLGDLRRAGLHARSSSKSTRNIGKLLKDAEGASARFAAIIEAPGLVTLKNLDAREERKEVPVGQIAALVRP